MRGIPLSGPKSRPADVETALLDIRKVSGTLRDANAVIIAGAALSLYQRDSDQLAGTTTTAADGTWSLSVNYTPSGYYAVYTVPRLAVTTPIMVGPYFTS